MASRKFFVVALVGGALVTTGCASMSRTLGMEKTTPNEFNILTKPPLVVPPEYNLRPPRTGELNVEEKYAQLRPARLCSAKLTQPNQAKAKRF